MTVIAAVSLAGGYTYRAIKSYASVIRQDGADKSITGRVTPGDFVKPGDVITIYERRF